jgi:primary-amine oxidase
MHVLDPLSPEEVSAAADAVRHHFAPHPVRFNDISVLEPPKRALYGASDRPLHRAARVVASVGPAFWELDVTFAAAARVAARRPIDLTRGQPFATADDCLLAEEIARSDPRVQRACFRALCVVSEFEYDDTTTADDAEEIVARHVAFDPWALHHCPARWTAARRPGATAAAAAAGGDAALSSASSTSPRVMQVFAYEKPSSLHNEYARPLPVVAAVDLGERRVVDVEEWLWEDEEEEEAGEGRPRRRSRPPPPTTTSTSAAAGGGGGGEYAPSLRGGAPSRADPPRPLLVSQPLGPSYRVDPADPWRVHWQGWSFRVGFSAREGLVLHDVAFAPYGGGGGGAAAAVPIAHRLSIAEMCVPYSDPRPPYNRRCALDAGDYGLGAAAVEQDACSDCAGGGDVHYFSPCLCDSKGEPRIIRNAVCLHEVDAGVLWKHVDYRDAAAAGGGGGGGGGGGSSLASSGAVRRARELVVGFAVVAVNYDYLFQFILGLDGTIRLEVRLTGVLSTSRLSCDEAQRGQRRGRRDHGHGDHGRGNNVLEDDGLPTHGTLVAPPRVNAGHHQHLFCARIDLAAGNARGGDTLVVSEVEPVAAASGGAGGDAGNGFTFRETALCRAPAGRDPAIGRTWRVSDPAASLHPLSRQPRALELRLSSPATLLAAPDSTAAKRALFSTKALWVTPHADGELFPTGSYAMNSAEDTGPMARWLAAGSAAASSTTTTIPDPVVWLTFGVTHEVRPEDYPIMPRDVCSFEIRPFGLLDGGNPAVDLLPAAARSRL